MLDQPPGDWWGKTGPITREIQKIFYNVIRGKVPMYGHWVDYLNHCDIPVSLPQSRTVSTD